MKRLMMVMMATAVMALAMFGKPMTTFAAETSFDVTSNAVCYSPEATSHGETWCSSLVVETDLYAITDTDTYLNFTWPYFGFSDILNDLPRYGRSKLHFYDSTETVLKSLTLYDWSADVDYFIFYLEDVFDSSIPGDLSYFSIEMIYDIGDEEGGNLVPYGFSTFIETYAVYDIDVELESALMGGDRNWDDRIFFYFDFGLYMALPADWEIDPVNPAIEYTVPFFTPPNPRTWGYDFDSWYTHEGMRYDWGDPIEENGAGLHALYAGIIPREPIGETDIGVDEGSVITAILTMIGFNNDAGRTIVFTILMLTLSVVLVAIKIPLFATALVAVIATIAFIMLGWLPVYAAIIMVITSLALMVLSLTRGEAS
jgi:hypothetical protein